MLALIKEGARVIDEQIARSPDDVDAIWCNGYGFPRHRGGPMFHSRELGASHVVARLRILEKQKLKCSRKITKKKRRKWKTEEQIMKKTRKR